jgi:hypothetical protein
MLFFCAVIYKYDALTGSDDLQDKMSLEQVLKHSQGNPLPRFAIPDRPRLCSQRENFIVPDWALSLLLLHSVWSSLLVAGALVVVQVATDVRNDANLRRLKYVETGLWVECKQLFDAQAYHLFLSHACASSARHGDLPQTKGSEVNRPQFSLAGPAAQDRMRAVKARLLECLPSCRTFLDVDGDCQVWTRVACAKPIT